jgi:hypothetical protein
MEHKKHEVHIDAIVQRLECLERQGHRWKATATLALITLGSRPPHRGWKKRRDLRAQ